MRSRKYVLPLHCWFRMKEVRGLIFADIHLHLLYGVDDGARTEEQMCRILDMAYADGMRTLCATPHYHPGYYGDNTEAVNTAFSRLCAYAEKYPDLELTLGNELRYSPGCFGWLQNGACRTLSNSRRVLIDFAEDEAAETIITAVQKLMNSGFSPVLAHAERYRRLHGNLRELHMFRDWGALIQVDTQSLLGEWDRASRKRSRKILDARLCDVVATDAHNESSRPPLMSTCFRMIADKYGSAYAADVCLHNPLSILHAGHQSGKK